MAQTERRTGVGIAGWSRRWVLVVAFALIGCSGTDDGLDLAEAPRGPVELQVGERAFAQFAVYPSTGLVVEVELSDPDVLTVAERRTERRGNSDEPGGDRGTTTFVLEALAEGTSVATFTVTMQDELDHEESYTIEVVADS